MQTEQKSIRVMLADDHPIVMTGFAMSLACEGMDVVGQAKTPDEAGAMFGELQPDVMVIDIRFGTELTGLDAAEDILKKFPKANIVFLSQFDQDSLIKETYRLGARAFAGPRVDRALDRTGLEAPVAARPAEETLHRAAEDRARGA